MTSPQGMPRDWGKVGHRLYFSVLVLLILSGGTYFIYRTAIVAHDYFISRSDSEDYERALLKTLENKRDLALSGRSDNPLLQKYIRPNLTDAEKTALADKFPDVRELIFAEPKNWKANAVPVGHDSLDDYITDKDLARFWGDSSTRHDPLTSLAWSSIALLPAAFLMVIKRWLQWVLKR